MTSRLRAKAPALLALLPLALAACAPGDTTYTRLPDSEITIVGQHYPLYRTLQTRDGVETEIWAVGFDGKRLRCHNPTYEDCRRALTLYEGTSLLNRS